jgi:hypothetical protein
MRFTRAKNGYETIILDIDHIPLTENYKFRCGYDSGKVFSSGVDGLEFTLDRIAPGNTVIFFNTGEDGRCELTVTPYEQNGILYASHGKQGCSLVNTRKTQKRGDYVKLASLSADKPENGCRVWHVVECRGVWEKR